MIVYAFQLVASLLVAVSAAAVMRALLRMTWSRRFPARACVVAAVCGAMSVAVLHASPPALDMSEIRRVDHMVRALAQELEQYRARHGHYPPTLEVAGLATPQSIYGPLRYRSGVWPDGVPHFRLDVADVHRNGFENGWGFRPGHVQQNMKTWPSMKCCA